MDNEREAPQVPQAPPSRPLTGAAEVPSSSPRALPDRPDAVAGAVAAQQPRVHKPAVRKQWPLSTVIITGALAFTVAGVGGVSVGWALGSAAHERVNFHQRPANRPGPFHPPGQRDRAAPTNSASSDGR